MNIGGVCFFITLTYINLSDGVFQFRGYPKQLAVFLEAGFTKNDDNNYIDESGSLILHKSNDNWRVEDAKAEILLSSNGQIKGTHNWTYLADTSKPIYALNFNNCSEEEFSCDDGLCLEIEKRCNFIPDCADESDEFNCYLIKTSPSYNPAVPNVKENTQIQLEVAFKILGVKEVDLDKKQFTVSFKTEISWKQLGLKFLNLRNNSINALTDEQTNRIWHPEMLFLNTVPISSTRILPRDCVRMEILRLTEPEPDDPTKLYKDEVYSGGANILRKTMQIVTKFHCSFSMNNYPFSVHSCNMKMIIDTIKPEFTNIHSSSLSIENHSFKDFIIINERIQVPNSQGIDRIGIFFEMKMQITNIVTTAYLPMSILNAICQMSIYLDLDCMFETILSVNATILVAISSFITSEIARLPKSDCMKPHEIWMLAMFFHPFLLIIAQIVCNLKPGGQKLQGALVQFTRVGIPLLYIIFNLVYFFILPNYLI